MSCFHWLTAIEFSQPFLARLSIHIKTRPQRLKIRRPSHSHSKWRYLGQKVCEESRNVWEELYLYLTVNPWDTKLQSLPSAILLNKHNTRLNRRPVKSPPEKFGRFFFLQKSVLMGLNFIPKQFRVVIGSSCRRFLQPKNARLCYKVLGAKTRKNG